VRLAGVVAPLVVLALLVAPAAALASSQDVTSTHAAIAADHALDRARVQMIAATQATVESYRARLAAECPDAGAGSPETEAAEPMSAEVANALWSIAYGAAAAPIARFAKVIGPLRWTSGRFSHAIHTLASSLSGLSEVRLPDICADVRAWTASGFETVPSDALELNRQLEPLQLPEIPWSVVARDERGGDASLVRYIEHAETKLAEAEFVLGQKDWYQVLETVGLAP
jgi:hypothetical protein